MTCDVEHHTSVLRLAYVISVLSKHCMKYNYSQQYLKENFLHLGFLFGSTCILYTCYVHVPFCDIKIDILNFQNNLQFKLDNM